MELLESFFNRQVVKARRTQIVINSNDKKSKEYLRQPFVVDCMMFE